MPRHAPRRLEDREKAAWFGFLRFHSLITRELDTLLVAAHGMPLVEFEVLLKLWIAGGRMRMSELSDAALLSRSGLTRVVDELESRELISREQDESDGRVLIATLTPMGRKQFLAARRTHLANVRRLFLDPLSTEDVDTLERVWRTLIGTLPRDVRRQRLAGRRRAARRSAVRPS